MSKRRIMAGFKALPPQPEPTPEPERVITLPGPEAVIPVGLIVDGSIRINAGNVILGANRIRVFDSDGNERVSLGVF